MRLIPAERSHLAPSHLDVVVKVAVVCGPRWVSMQIVRRFDGICFLPVAEILHFMCPPFA